MRYLLGFILLLPMVVFAKDPPLPEALLNAKTAVVYDSWAADSIDNDKDFDKFCKELKKWGRFQFVQDRESADIVIYLSSRKIEIRKSTAGLSPYERGLQRQEIYTANEIVIWDARNHTLLWSDSINDSTTKNPKFLVSRLKHRMEQK